ncbi:hypothetical protein Cme02nite_09250 [Catellatospora methionotrophica]|uniref:MmgE/PrpD N-terminal domain-containing protein n=1 Tax=Catellatospora methionotrophica TaxID=121620 RepID=A0A8J3L1F7_9ACTN|nr:MmgE/PrpD family protein [Catellatospora methionotrophica]GIG12593.1 hypothetical protein Cme02nite_09250 [Catellatospora methionotrophica]
MPDLITWAAGLTWADIPDHVRTAARHRLLDGLGCLIAGVRRTEALAAARVALSLGGPPESTLLGGADGEGPVRVGAAAAAFGNAVAMHALDFDDTQATGLVHATAVTAPVALALAEQTGASGEEMLAAYTVGLVVACRLGAAVPHAFHARGVHATSACGTIAGAVVAARLLGLDAATTAHAAGIAASGSSGLLEFLHTGGSTEQPHPGFAAHAAVVAARLAAAAPGRIRAPLAHGRVPRCGGGHDDPRLDVLPRAPARADLGERADAVLAALAALPTAPDVKELVTCLA